MPSTRAETLEFYGVVLASGKHVGNDTLEGEPQEVGMRQRPASKAIQAGSNEVAARPLLAFELAHLAQRPLATVHVSSAWSLRRRSASRVKRR